MTGQKVTSAHARDLLEERFTDNRGCEATVLLVDELDKVSNVILNVLKIITSSIVKFCLQHSFTVGLVSRVSLATSKHY